MPGSRCLSAEGSLVGIYSAHWRLTQHVLVVACDMPFSMSTFELSNGPLPDMMWSFLAALKVEALYAVYFVRCIQPIERLLRQGKVMIVNFFPEVRVRYVDTPNCADLILMSHRSSISTRQMIGNMPALALQRE